MEKFYQEQLINRHYPSQVDTWRPEDKINIDSTWELGRGVNQSGSNTANLVFYGNHLLLASRVANRQIFMTLDTGAETTDLVIESITVPKLGFLIGGTARDAPSGARDHTG